MLSLASLLVYSTAYEKIRVGGNYDGGYVMAKDLTYDHCITAGIANDISFETSFLALYPELTCESYDGTINQLPSPHSRINFHKENIGPRMPVDQLHTYKNVFVKCDTEGGEHPWIESLSQDELNSIAQIVIEIHQNHGPDLTTPAKLALTHTLIHIHGNNCCPLYNINGTRVPQIFEATYVRNDLVSSVTLNKNPVPGPLDMPNLHWRSDIDLNYYPFVSQ